ncbi:MAG TPA: hypothetical protein VKA78_17920, partial [Pyrinomonadaceae bacterium]|nr:hypothetical protein [Pyrinomonadaceae bacterium]
MNRLIKALLICGVVVSTIGLLSFRSSSQSAPVSQVKLATHKTDDYIGSEACKDCHEDQFKNFSHT